MTYSISISEAAENDISEAYLWYEDQKENLGSIFEVQFQRAVKSIRNNPFKTQIRYGNMPKYWDAMLWLIRIWNFSGRLYFARN